MSALQNNSGMSKTMKRMNLRSHGGFSLIEILVVVVIIGILAAVVVPRVMDEPDRARVTRAQQDVQALVTALNMYKLDNFNYPSTEQGLEALTRQPSGQPPAPNWKEGGYIDRLPRDPWGNEYQFLNPGVHGDIDEWSLGANGMAAGEGINAEIDNWQHCPGHTPLRRLYPHRGAGGGDHCGGAGVHGGAASGHAAFG